MNNKIKFLTAFLSVGILFSCDSDDDAPEQIIEEEVITTVTFTLKNDADDSNVVTFKAFDSDADGPALPVETITGDLRTNAIYTGSITFLNETVDPPEDITEEVLELALEHEVFYGVTTDGVSIVRTDTDSEGNPLGLETIVTTGEEGDGSLTITLIHEPIKPNTGLSSAGGEPDVEVTFAFEVEEEEED